MRRRALHSALLQISAQQLAIARRDRISDFRSIDPSILEVAKENVASLEKELEDRLSTVHTAFAELIKRAISKPGIANDNVSVLELNEINEKLSRLENAAILPSSYIAPPPQPPQPPSEIPLPPPPPSPTVPPTEQGGSVVNPSITHQAKRKRARDVLDKIVNRLEILEDFKDEIEVKLGDIEDQTLELTGLPTPVRSWDDLENRRDPTGKLRGQPSISLQTLPGPIQQSGTNTSSLQDLGKAEEGTLEDVWEDFENRRDHQRMLRCTGDQRGHAEATFDQIRDEAAAAAATTSESRSADKVAVKTTMMLQTEIEELRKEVEDLRCNREQWMTEAVASASSSLRDMVTEVRSFPFPAYGGACSPNMKQYEAIRECRTDN